MLYKRCDSCGVVRRVPADRIACGMSRPSRELTERNGHQYHGPADGGMWDCTGTLATTDGCHAVIHHGPGHQSTTRCRVAGEHVIHEAIVGHDRQFAEWAGDEATTDFFDQAPSVV